jgi:phosphoribosylformylglycinamidine synthase
LNKLKGVTHSQAPYFDLEEEFNLQQLVASLIKDGKLNSAHDISEGGLIVTLLESAFYNHKGFEVTSNGSSLRKDAYWLGEAQSRVLVSVDTANVAAIEAAATKHGIKTTVLGKVTASDVIVECENWGSIGEWKNVYDTVIEKQLAKK